MAAVTIRSDFAAQENKVSLFSLFPNLFVMKWWDQMPWSEFSESWALSQLFHSPLSLSSRGFFSSSSLSAIRVVSSAYLKLLICLLAVFIPAWASSSPAFHLHISWCTLHISWISRMTIYSLDVILSQFGTSLLFYVASNCCIWPAYKFLRRQVRWSGIPISLRIFHSLLWFTQSKALG